MTKIILASNSPRRKKILTDLGLDFEVIPSNYEEKLETDISDKNVFYFNSLNKIFNVRSINLISSHKV